MTLRLATVDGTALAGVEYRRLDKSVIIPKYPTTVRVPLQIFGDLNPEDDETFTLDVSSSTPGVAVATPVVTVTILDDD